MFGIRCRRDGLKATVLGVYIVFVINKGSSMGTLRKFFFVQAVALAFIAFGIVSTSNVLAADADPTIEFEVYKAGFIVGVSGGSGTLHYKGKSYPVKIGGVSLGATIGASKAEMIGSVKGLKTLADIEGTYSALQAGVAVAGGAKATELKNSKDVVLSVKGKQIGLEFSLDLNGMEISLK